MPEPVLIPIAEVSLLESDSESGSEQVHLLLLPTGGVSPLSLTLKSVREQLAPIFEDTLSAEQLVRAINALVDEELYVTIGAHGWSLSLQPRGSEAETVSLDARGANRVSPGTSRITVGDEGESVAARIVDVSTDGGGCALECNGAALQALLANNMFHVSETHVPGSPDAPPVEIEVRSVTRTGVRFRVGCQVTGGSGRVKKLVS